MNADATAQTRILEFLSACVEHAMASGVQTRQSFISHFPDLASHRIKRFGYITRVAPAEEVWAFITGGEFWRASAETEGAAYARAQTMLGSLLETALAQRLFSVKSMVAALGLERILEHLPPELLAAHLAQALEQGEAGKPFTLEALLGDEPVVTLVRSVPVAIIWEQVVDPLASKAGFVRARPPVRRSKIPGRASRPPKRDSQRPAALIATDNRRALNALLRSKTGTTMEVRLADLVLEDMPGRRPPAKPPPLPAQRKRRDSESH